MNINDILGRTPLEYFRPELKVWSSLKTEKELTEETKIHIASGVYLSKGDLESLRALPKWEDVQPDEISSHYPRGVNRKDKRHKRVRILEANPETSEMELEVKLKLALFERGCNSGFDYKTYQKGEYLVAEAIPAEIGRPL